MPRYWIPAFAGMAVSRFDGRGIAVKGSRYQPLCPITSFRAEWNGDPESIPIPATLRHHVIPGGVKRRPGIHAKVLDSRFRGNDGGWIRRAWECADRDGASCQHGITCCCYKPRSSSLQTLLRRGRLSLSLIQWIFLVHGSDYGVTPFVLPCLSVVMVSFMPRPSITLAMVSNLGFDPARSAR